MTRSTNRAVGRFRLGCGEPANASSTPCYDGFTFIGLVLTISIVTVMVGIGVPLAQSAIQSYELSAAVANISGVIDSTRYQAVMYGCPYQLSVDKSTSSYQVSYEALSGTPEACASTFSDVGGAVPWTTSDAVSLASSTALQFNPNGIVTAVSGSSTLSLTAGSKTEQIIVSGVGNVTVSP
jgi:Tfp pilus assembly protein FimT